MKRLSIMAVGTMIAASLFATDRMAPAAEPEVVNPDSTGFTFTDVKINKTGSVKDQNKSGTCWAFSGVSTLEDNVLRKGGPELDISEMFIVRHAYIDKAKKFMRMNGNITFAQGGSWGDVLNMTMQYGAMPEEAYTGLNYGEAKHSHYEMAEAMEAYLRAVLNRGQKNSKLTDAWLPGLIGILDAYLGPLPESFTYKGKTYTPQSWAKEMGLEPENFVNITSYTHHPFYESFILEIPDNWAWTRSMNVPMEEMQRIVDNALDKGWTVMWAADVSEGGFKWTKGYALLPDDKDTKDMTDTELSRWVKLSDKDRADAKFDIKGPIKEKTVSQESRQKTFDNFETTDDHGMVIVGTATDQEGNKYYKVKNSWDTNQIYDGYLYVSMPFFLEKTLGVGVHKDAIPADINKKCKW
ncbi:MAG: C1 family peptidase [Muribaculaceae bacterium]|nr:aminopeptidase [Muribaculaceae bacterium]MDD6702195.1 C1 family peptidase [Bacteroidales bacterium]MDD6942513.1 C1 family peptidase [Bacteroidales bacterium]MDY2733977.1 C1 family peptidase [Muribaculaceae bacterium]MDY4649112.1 C1 family peptidase [Muribaculaceae bacterium]